MESAHRVKIENLRVEMISLRPVDDGDVSVTSLEGQVVVVDEGGVVKGQGMAWHGKAWHTQQGMVVSVG